MPAHRPHASTGLADIAPEQHQIDQHMHVIDAVAVLGQPHAIDRDDAFGAAIDFGGIGDRLAGEPAFTLDIVPSGAAGAGREGFEAVGVFGDEGVIEHRRLALDAGRIVGLDRIFAHAHDRRDVAAGLNLMILR